LGREENKICCLW